MTDHRQLDLLLSASRRFAAAYSDGTAEEIEEARLRLFAVVIPDVGPLIAAARELSAQASINDDMDDAPFWESVGKVCEAVAPFETTGAETPEFDPRDVAILGGDPSL